MSYLFVAANTDWAAYEDGAAVPAVLGGDFTLTTWIRKETNATTNGFGVYGISDDLSSVTTRAQLSITAAEDVSAITTRTPTASSQSSVAGITTSTETWYLISNRVRHNAGTYYPTVAWGKIGRAHV